MIRQAPGANRGGPLDLPRDRLYAHLPIASQPRPEAQDGISRLMQPRRLRRGETLFTMGQTEHLCGWVDQGLIRLFYLAPSGSECTKLFFRPDEWFISGFDPAENGRICLQACTDAVVWTVDLQRYLQLMHNDASLARAHIALLSRHIALNHGREVALLTLSGTDRYLRFLRFYGEWAEQIPQVHIASAIGLTPTQLSRIRRKLGMIPDRAPGNGNGSAEPGPAR